MKRRIVSVLTVLALFLGLCPFSAFAAGTSGSTLELHTQTTAVTDKKDDEHYEWKDLTVESSTTIKKGTLVLYNGFNAEKVTLPGEGAEVKIDIQGNSTIETLAYSRSGSASIQLTFTGTKGNTLTILNHINFAGDNNSTITVAENAEVVANNGISVGASGGVDGSVIVNGRLTATAGVGIAENGDEYPTCAINTGKVKIGANGKLIVSGSEGVKINGNPAGKDMNDVNGIFENAFFIESPGRFEANCDDYNIKVNFELRTPDETKLGSYINLPSSYLPDQCNYRLACGLKPGSNLVSIEDVSTPLSLDGNGEFQNLIKGKFMLHEQHDWDSKWKSDENYHWHNCNYTESGEQCVIKRDYKEHTEADNWSPQTPAAVNQNGTRAKVCETCGREMRTQTSYYIDVDVDVTQGTAAPSTEDACEGEPVTLTVTPNGDYQLEADISVYSINADSELVCSGPTNNGIYRFTMPDGPVKVKVTFTKKSTDNSGGGTTPGNPGGSSGGGGGSSGSYTIKIEKPEHGEVTSDRRYTDQGELVRLTVKPDSGYRLTGLTVTDGRGNEIAVTEEADGTFTFTMPNSSVTVRASFGPDGQSGCGGGIDCPSRAYRDLDTSQWYHLAVDYVLRNGLMSGYGNQTFGPNDPLTRAQFAQILYNKAGRPAVTGSSPFTDVDPGEWFAPAIAWAAGRGVVNGYGNGLFGPNDSITREQLAAMLWRYSDCPEPTISQLDFTDAAKISPYALEPLRWAVELHVVNGLGNRVLDPQGLASRAQIAQMLLNLFGR